MKKLLFPLLIILPFFGLKAQSNSAVLPIPTAEFSWTLSPTDSCSPLTVHFNNESSNATSYFWLMLGGDPSTSTAVNPTVLYTTPGVYDVSMIATNSEGSGTVTKTGIIVVYPAISASFTSNINGSTVNFTNTSAEASSYVWYFGDGDTSTVASPSHTYTTGGDIMVTLIATGDCGTDTATQVVSIPAPPTADFTSDITSGCVPFTVQFSSQPSTNANGYLWEFPGGNPPTSTDPNPVVEYTNAFLNLGVGLTVTNDLGTDSEYKPTYIHANGKPTSNIHINEINGLSATVSSYSYFNITNTLWDFGDGATSTEVQFAAHTYANDGIYVLSLTTENECGSTTVTENLEMIAKPTVDFTVADTIGCIPVRLKFQNQSINATAYNWKFPGSNTSTSTEVNPTATYYNSGTFMVILTAYNAAGSTVDTQWVNVQLRPNPAMAGAILNENGLTVAFGYTDTTVTNILWDFDDGTTSTEFYPVHTFPYGGFFGIHYNVSNEFCTVQHSLFVDVSPAPTANFAVLNPTACVSTPVQFVNESSDIATSLEWTFEGGTPSTSTEEAPLVSFPATGTYEVSLIASNAFGADTFSYPISIVLDSPILLDFSVIINGLTASFQNNSTNANSYLWNFGEGTTSTETAPTYTYPEDGDYFVRLTASNACGDVIATQWVSIATAPTAGFSADTTSGCAPLTVQFFNESSDNADSFSWNFQSGSPSTSTDENPIVVFNTPGTYSVDLTVSNSAGQNTFSAANLITVNTAPTAGFSAFATEATVSFLNTSQNATSFIWDFGDGETSTESSPTHNYAASGDFTVVLTAYNECGSVSSTQEVNITGSSTGAVSEITSLKISPNPNSGSFWVEISGQSKPFVQFELFNSLGQTVGKEAAGFQSGSLKEQLDFGSLPSGLYNLRVGLGDGASYVRVMVR
ncbi:MAG: PKD domain-containing protein [Saprospiraceae bacterium]|nr:PKD domain-containing protein [Saprospiraceae bacterium]